MNRSLVLMVSGIMDELRANEPNASWEIEIGGD
jgi:hypothetical protein